jgi:hypothetical protein
VGGPTEGGEGEVAEPVLGADFGFLFDRFVGMGYRTLFFLSIHGIWGGVV